MEVEKEGKNRTFSLNQEMRLKTNKAGIRHEQGNLSEFRVALGFNREINATAPATIYMFTVNYA